ncbi:MAG: hypothetical protein AAGB26_12115 [Planctomycetota bacterium]
MGTSTPLEKAIDSSAPDPPPITFQSDGAELKLSTTTGGKPHQVLTSGYGYSSDTAIKLNGDNGAIKGTLRLPNLWDSEQSKVKTMRADLDSFKRVILQQWEAVVDSKDGDQMSMRLFDLKDKYAPVEVVTISVDELPQEEDRRNTTVGSVLYWTIGYERRRGGQRMRFTEIRPKRLPKIDHTAQLKINMKARKLAEKFGLDEE